jgi:hypothetical protein
MRSLKQIEASRANGRLSRGPLTEEGKRKSSRNSVRHGLLACSVVCQSESESRFLEFLNQLMEEHQPATPTQHMLVETMAVSRWRLIRTWEMQRSILECGSEHDGGGSAQERAIRDMAKSDPLHCHQLLLRYEVALDRQFHKALRELQRLQTLNTPPAKRTQEVPETKETPLTETPVIAPLKYATATGSAAISASEVSTDAVSINKEERTGISRPVPTAIAFHARPEPFRATSFERLNQPLIPESVKFASGSSSA